MRVLHWTLAASVLGAFFIERPRDLHEALGYVALGAVAVRLIWGVVGPEHARFAAFAPSPRRLLSLSAATCWRGASGAISGTTRPARR